MDATGASTVQVACLHYNFARVVVRESLNRTVVAVDLVDGLSSIFTDGITKDFRYLWILCAEIGPHLTTLVSRARFSLSIHLQFARCAYHCHSAASKNSSKNRFLSRISCFLGQLDAARVAARISESSTSELTSAANLIRYLRPLNALHADVLKALDISALASTASNSKATQLHGIADLLRQLGTRRTELLEDLSISTWHR